ncbi:LysM peptidoglycan-binding domain-containing protein [Geoalkalibacter sp.]|uniref:LysM peptidoglycan-binding domain-containing protein n=1 Tax=Geoalkalibacter sp. TaxID=3041440 RepID=UPI00272E9FF3|nr:LysM peptidoglycan-binding domain-containing protein [Geoalkalibacter sp.]
MSLKKILVLALVLLGAGLTSAAEEPRIYTIKKGDTLWGISERFIKDPLYWPNLWANNPDIRNPHFIYPGQKLRIFSDRIEIVGAEENIEEVHMDGQKVVPAVSDSIRIKAMGGGEGFLEKTIGSVGSLVDATDNRIMMGPGDRVFVELTDPGRVAPGDRFTIFRLSDRVTHPATGEFLGYFVQDLGTLQITELHPQVAAAQIIDANSEVTRGALLRPYQPAPREVALKEAVAPLSGTLIGGRQENLALAQNMIAYVDLGSDDGLQAGNLMIISRPRKASEIAMETRTTPLQLPETVLGAGVILETQPHSAAMLIIKSVDAIQRGDRVHAEMR